MPPSLHSHTRTPTVTLQQSTAKNKPYHGLFRLSDDAHTGLVSLEALRHTLNMMGARLSQDEAKMVAGKLAQRADGMVDYEGLYRLLLGTPPPEVKRAHHIRHWLRSTGWQCTKSVFGFAIMLTPAVSLRVVTACIIPRCLATLPLHNTELPFEAVVTDAPPPLPPSATRLLSPQHLCRKPTLTPYAGGRVLVWPPPAILPSTEYGAGIFGYASTTGGVGGGGGGAGRGDPVLEDIASRQKE